MALGFVTMSMIQNLICICPRPDFDTTFWIKDTCIEPSHSRHIGIGDITIANRWVVLRFVNLIRVEENLYD